MKPHFSDMTLEQQESFGNGCSFVPDFIFTASCQQHDFNYGRGGLLFDKIKADWDMCTHMLHDSTIWWHYLVVVVYWLGLTFTPFTYFSFRWRLNYLSLEEIISRDKK